MRLAEPQLNASIAPGEGVLVRRSWQKHLLTFLMVFGPGLIVMEADNDAGAVSTYMQAGDSTACICFGPSLCFCPSATSYRRWWLGWGLRPAKGTRR